MKIINKKYALIIGFILLLGLNLAYGYDSEEYEATIKNDSDNDIYVKLQDSKCMLYVNHLPNIIFAHSDIKVTLADDGEGDCNGDGKYMTLAFQVLDDYDVNDEISQDSSKFDLIRFKHERGHPDSDDWYNNIYLTFAKEYDSEQMPGRTMIIHATCDGNDCHSKWYEEAKGFELVIEVTDAAEYFTSIGLGTVSVTDGLGRLVKLNQVNIDSEDDIYMFKFSKSQETCNYGNKMIRCDNGLGSTFRSESLVFFCRQTDGGDPACPWTSVSDNSSSNYYTSIY
ncbi:MAG: hypothetical protein EP298_13310 [Gammaproteobacteria bacterium]|nr:MAG: hypothetical protein EP298_13310 [Gammaproteobacteria bacterium]UTW41743.1 hypothetical protein KFE69_09525 [bacterium SCSIO 12844]